MTDDVGVGGVLEAGHGVRAECEQPAVQRAPRVPLLTEAVAQDVAPAIVCHAVAQRDRVDHPVAVEPVVRTARLERRIGPVAQKRARELGRYPSLDLEVLADALDAPGSEVALEEGVHLRFSRTHRAAGGTAGAALGSTRRTGP